MAAAYGDGVESSSPLHFVKDPEMKRESPSSFIISSEQPLSFTIPVSEQPNKGGILAEDAFLRSIPPPRSGRTRKKEERFAQWGYHETRELIIVRAELEKSFTTVKKSKALWESVAQKMNEKGFHRSGDQCKYKWKNLVSRFKGIEMAEPDSGRQCPFFEELDAVFKERANSMHGMLLESEFGRRPKKKVKDEVPGVKFLDEDSDEDDDEEESEDELLVRRKRRKELKERQRLVVERCRATSLQEALEDFFHQQFRVEEQWQEVYERRDLERRTREQEWRASMEKLEQERIMREQEYLEREEERRNREEVRSQKRDDLFAVLVTSFLQNDS